MTWTVTVIKALDIVWHFDQVLPCHSFHYLCEIVVVGWPPFRFQATHYRGGISRPNACSAANGEDADGVQHRCVGIDLYARIPRDHGNADSPGPQLNGHHRKGLVGIQAQEAGLVLHNALCQSIPELFIACSRSSDVSVIETPVVHVCTAKPELVGILCAGVEVRLLKFESDK